MKVAVKAAVIGAIAVLAASGIAVAWDAFNKRPVIDYRFSTETSFFFDPADYQSINFHLRNRGVMDGNLLVTIAADGAQVAFPQIGQYNTTISAPFYVPAENEWSSSDFRLKPIGSPESISLTLSVSSTDIFGQVTPPSINKLIYDKYQAGYQLRKT